MCETVNNNKDRKKKGKIIMIQRIKSNLIKISELQISAEGLIPSEAVLGGVNPIYGTDANGKRTDNIEGFRYDLTDPSNYSTFTIKVMGTTPVITQKELEKSETPVLLEIPVEQVVIKPYKLEYGKATLSITAPSVKLAK